MIKAMRLGLGLLLPTLAIGEEFRSSYVRFLLPAGWACDLEEAEFVCSPPSVEGEPTPAIIILTAKLVGADDSLMAQYAHLTELGEALGQDALIRNVSFHDIGGTTWVDATIAGAEVPNYWTRYLATVDSDLSVLYTFSAHKDYFESFENGAMQVVSSLELLDDWKSQ